MEDRELLNLAAKAAGATKCEYTELPGEDYGFYADFGNGMEKWYPLTDDGDALRLAVKLHLSVEIWAGSSFHKQGVTIVEHDNAAAEFPHNSDPYAATRRAIVCAAAEIGEAQN